MIFVMSKINLFVVAFRLFVVVGCDPFLSSLLPLINDI